MLKSRPAVLCFSGHDPSGGAGIQADIETLTSHHCHAATVITALTEQDSHNAQRLLSQNPEDFKHQAELIIADCAFDAIKIGMIGSAEIAEVIAEILSSHAQIPVVYDPVLAAGGGAEFADGILQQSIIETLLPLTTVLTPNTLEARRLSGQTGLDECANNLLSTGCQYLLMTGGHEPGEQLCNRLYHQQQCVENYYWQRLDGAYHGSGCTLASAIAALLAHGLSVPDAVNEAQEYTWNTLRRAYRTGGGQLNPNRFFWTQDD